MNSRYSPVDGRRGAYRRDAVPCTKMVTIREATIADTPEIARVHESSARGFGRTHYTSEEIETWVGGITPERYLHSIEEQYVVVAVEQGEIVGWGQLNAEKSEIVAVYVTPARAGAGVGRALLTHLEEVASNLGCRTLSLWSSLNAVRFHQRYGYRVTERSVDKLSDDEIPAVRMVKTTIT